MTMAAAGSPGTRWITAIGLLALLLSRNQLAEADR